MKAYTIIGGVNGTGKSSFTGVFSVERNDLGVIVDTNKIVKEHGGDRLKGGKAALSLIGRCIADDVDFTQETTLSGIRTLKNILLAREKGYSIRLYYIGISSAEESIKRIANRVAKGGHSIPSEDVRRRFAKRYEDILRILPYCNEAYFYDNENGFVLSAAYRNGQIRPIGNEKAPEWIDELISYIMTKRNDRHG